MGTTLVRTPDGLSCAEPVAALAGTLCCLLWRQAHLQAILTLVSSTSLQWSLNYRSPTSPVKLIDFSLACFFFEPSEPGGTPEFMAPELVGDPDGMAATGWGPEIDMWAVGVLVFWMLCGRTPFDDDNIPHILQNIMQVHDTAILHRAK